MRRGWLALALGPASFAMLAHGCSSSSSGQGQSVDAGEDVVPFGDSGADIKVTLEGGSCQPGSVTTFQPPAYRHASGAYQGKCTSTDIDDFFSACLGLQQSAQACAAWSPDSGTTKYECAACILTPWTATTYGAVVAYGSVGFINQAGCVELLDPNGLTCAKAIQAAIECDDVACATNCPLSDQASLQAFDSCRTEANGGGCKAYADAAACLSTEGAAGAGICVSGDYHDIAMLICGPSSADAGAD